MQHGTQFRGGPPAEGRTGGAKPTARNRWNLEGAFPLLLVGSALLCYAAVLANEEIASQNTHLPLWGLFGAVGAVIAGAGIYSTFFVPSEVPALGLSKDWVTVPRAEWEALRAPSAKRTAPPTSAAPAAVRPSSSRPAPPRPVWEEDWNPDSDAFRAAASPPAPADFVLQQIEEIEESLRKKRATARATKSQR